MTVLELETEINKFFLDSEKETGDELSRQRGIYPNSVIMTEQHYKEFLKELFRTLEDADVPEGLFINSICGLKVIFSDTIEKPKVIRM